MAISFKSRSRTDTTCRHDVEMVTEVAGMSRSFCEACGRVSVAYVENHLSQTLRIEGENNLSRTLEAQGQEETVSS